MRSTEIHSYGTQSLRVGAEGSEWAGDSFNSAVENGARMGRLGDGSKAKPAQLNPLAASGPRLFSAVTPRPIRWGVDLHTPQWPSHSLTKPSPSGPAASSA